MAERTRTTRARPVLRRPTWRETNLALLAVLLLAFATGLGAVATGGPRGGWVAVAHGVVGLGVVALVPAKRRVVAGGLRRRRPDRWAALVLAALAVASLGSGIVASAGLLPSLAGLEPLWWHIALALALVLPLAWHVVARPMRLPLVRRGAAGPRGARGGRVVAGSVTARRVVARPVTSLDRRDLLRVGLLAATAGALYGGLTGAAALADLPGARRRFTGSHAVDPAQVPVTSWLDDAVPQIDAAAWRLRLGDADGPRDLTLAALLAGGTTTVRATLDCTSGWYATQDWTGVPVARLLGRVDPGHRSIRVRSSTGYDRYLPVADLEHLLLAVGVDGRALTPGHGHPARLVAPGRRGFWWVKWVVGVELSRRPWWAQPPFPLT